MTTKPSVPPRRTSYVKCPACEKDPGYDVTGSRGRFKIDCRLCKGCKTVPGVTARMWRRDHPQETR